MAANQKILIIIVLIAIILIIGGFFVWKKYYQTSEAPPVSPKTEDAGLGSQIYEQVQNPAEKLPEVNPFEKKTNPFEETKTNPFKDVYKNPFE